MITPQDIRAKALRRWSSYAYHRLCLSGTSWEAFDIPFGKPGGRELLKALANIRESLHELQASAKATLGYGYRIDFEEAAGRYPPQEVQLYTQRQLKRQKNAHASTLLNTNSFLQYSP